MTAVRSLWFGDMIVPAKSMREIARDTAEARGVSLDDLMSRNKCKRFAHARQQAMWLMFAQSRSDGSHRFSIPQIGAFFGMDHTSALYGIKAHAEREGVTYIGRSGGAVLNPLRSKVMAIRRLAA